MPDTTPSARARTLRRALRRTLAARCLAGAAARAAAAQPATGTVEGVARSSEGDAAPIPFALVRLVPVDTQQAPIQGITNANGRFHFGAVPAGDYRLHLLRIGYAPVVSPVLPVRAGDTVQQVLRGAAEALRLAAVVVHPGRCVQGDALAEEPDVATLWNEARKGVELRRGVELRYGYTRTVRTTYEPEGQRDGAHQRVTTDRLVSRPDSIPLREERVRQLREKEGYGKPNALRVPSEKELLGEEFATTHCLETVPSDDGKLVGLRFRPTARQKGGLAIRGTIWLAPTTFLIQRLDLEHVDGGKLDTPFSAVRIDYGDVAIGGQSLRLAVGGDVAIFATHAHSTLEFSYGDFEEVRTP